MLLNNCELNIIVNGRRVDEFKSPMDFQTYIEGRDGSAFEVELVNNNPYECEFIVSVDGLSVTDGKAAGERSGGYVVPANSRYRVPGWLVDGSTAAKFTFAGAKGGSYAEEAEEGDARNKGVIATKVFGRKNAYAARRQVPTAFRSSSSNSIKKSAAPSRATFGSGNARGMDHSFSYTSSMTSGALNSSDTAFQNMAVGATASCVSPQALDPLQVGDAVAMGAPEVEQTLGTAFGEATDFNTTTVQFERGDLLAMIVMHYDDRQGLKRRGIDVTRKNNAANPFPADSPQGCAPPQGWSR